MGCDSAIPRLADRYDRVKRRGAAPRYTPRGCRWPLSRSVCRTKAAGEVSLTARDQVTRGEYRRSGFLREHSGQKRVRACRA